MRKTMLIILSILLFIGIGYAGYHSMNNQGKEMSYPSFIEAAEKNEVETVYLTANSDHFKVILNDSSIQYTVPNPKTENFTEYLLLHNIEVKQGQYTAATTLLKIILVVALFGVVFFLIQKNSAGKMIISDANKNAEERPLITLNQIAGNTEAKSMVTDVIQFIKNPEKYSKTGARMPKGLLLYGPPGTGKTLMAKAIAGEAGVPFYAMSGSDFVQMYVGVGASRIRNLFQKAKKSEKAVIFIDEIDAIGKKRARSLSASNDERDQTLNALLTEMSGFHDSDGIVVIAATNRLDTLDEALLRPGRFDRQIEIGLPDVNARKQILNLYASRKPLSDDVKLEELAKSTVYFSGAMLENLLNESAILAANAERTNINQDDIDKAFYTVIAGAPKTDRSYITDRERSITAYHEAGHALATTLLLPENYVSKVTIIPSVQGAGGFSLSIPKDTMFQSRRQIKSNIQVLLAGRIAEELIFGTDEITTGAGNDIQKASSLLYDFMNKYGMDDEIGLFSTSAFEENRDSELLSQCRDKMKLFYQETKELIRSNILHLENITKQLLEKESLNGEDIAEIIKDGNL